jgi:hypothetical protein
MDPTCPLAGVAGVLTSLGTRSDVDILLVALHMTLVAAAAVFLGVDLPSVQVLIFL